MEYCIEKFDELTNEKLYAVLKLRVDVFVVEQHCPYHEIDDLDQNAVHLTLMEDQKILSYLRVFWKEQGKTAQIGRVISAVRGKGYGLLLLNKAVLYARDVMHAEDLYLEAQVYAIPFYEKAGFRVISDPFDIDGISHVEMTRKASA